MSMKNKVMTAAAVFALSTGAAFAESHMSEAGNAMVGGAEMLPDMTIVQNASNAENLTTLVTTVGGCVLDVKRVDNGDSQDLITITDERGQVATVTQADVLQSNGVVHVIDTVMLPAE